MMMRMKIMMMLLMTVVLMMMLLLTTDDDEADDEDGGDDGGDVMMVMMMTMMKMSMMKVKRRRMMMMMIMVVVKMLLTMMKLVMRIVMNIGSFHVPDGAVVRPKAMPQVTLPIEPRPVSDEAAEVVGYLRATQPGLAAYLAPASGLVEPDLLAPLRYSAAADGNHRSFC
eukprot:s2701_g3.t1